MVHNFPKSNKQLSQNLNLFDFKNHRSFILILFILNPVVFLVFNSNLLFSDEKYE
jgi:hypothetical protein